MGVCGLSLMGLYDLQPVSPDLNMTERAKAHMKNVHLKWEQQKALRLEVLQKTRDKSKSNTIDKTHTASILLAFAIGLGAVFIPWIYSIYFETA